MLPELSIERVFRRELDSLPLPDERLWMPNRRSGSSATVAIAVGCATLVLVLAAVGLVRDASGAATQRRGALTTPPVLQPRASCAPPALGTKDRCVTLLPNAVRNPTSGYNLIIPGQWREVQMPPGSEPFVPGRIVGPALTAPYLLDRRVFSARPPEEWRLSTNNAVPAWELDVQVWDRQGRTAVDWARTSGPCDPAMVSLGGTSCVQTIETIRGITFVVTTIHSFRDIVTTSYYLERGDQMLILRYETDPTVAPPPGVTTTTLEEIVHSIGVV